MKYILTQEEYDNITKEFEDKITALEVANDVLVEEQASYIADMKRYQMLENPLAMHNDVDPADMLQRERVGLVYYVADLPEMLQLVVKAKLDNQPPHIGRPR